MKTGIKVADVMKKRVVAVRPDDNCDKALRYMVDLGIGSVLVTEGKQPIGIVTDSNLLERVFYLGKDPKKLPIEKVMSHPLRTITPEEDVGEASTIMRDLGVKRLPVVRKKELVGIITESDIISISPALYEIIAEAVEMRCGLPEKAIGRMGGE